MPSRLLAALLTAALLAGCGGDDEPAGAVDPDTTKEDRLASRESTHPSIVDVKVTRGATRGTYDFSVTVSSPYDSKKRFANGWRVVGDDFEVYGRRKIERPHPDEQPFTLAQRGVKIPDRIRAVHVEGRDSRNGYGGRRYVIALPGRELEAER